MKGFFLASVGLAALIAGPAMAADMRVAAPPPPVAYYDWSGAYVGFNVGGVWHKNNVHFPTPGAAGLGIAGVNPDFSINGSNGIYGFHAGAQWQWGAWVLGVEAALSGCMQECRESAALPVGYFAANTSFETKMTNLFTLGPRLGYAFDRWMIFATGGWASANLKGTPCSTLTGLCNATGAFIGASRNDGWYAGGGIDYMVHKGPLVDVILGAEYQHYDVGGRRAFCINPGCSPATGGDYDLGATGDIVRARLTIKTHGYGFFL
ncbi:MAG TPA: hypothetical protein VGF59_12495 [Bryobacteraceae bacterium]